MTITLVVLLVAVGAGVIAFGMSVSRALPDPVDSTAEERATVKALDRRPRLARFLRRRLDRRSAGGLLLTVSLIVVFVVALIVGLLLDNIDESGWLGELDDEVAAWGAEHATSAAIDVLKVITQLGGTWVVVAALAAASVADWIRRRNAEVFLFAAVVIIGEKLIVNGMKWLVDRDRPDVMWLVSWSGASFPSGHTAAAAAAWPAVALILGRDRSRRTRALLAAGAALISVAVAASRALLGVHWLTDVLAGLVIGWGWFLIVAIAFGGRAQRLGDPATTEPRGVRGADAIGALISATGDGDPGPDGLPARERRDSPLVGDLSDHVQADTSDTLGVDLLQLRLFRTGIGHGDVDVTVIADLCPRHDLTEAMAQGVRDQLADHRARHQPAPARPAQHRPRTHAATNEPPKPTASHGRGRPSPCPQNHRCAPDPSDGDRTPLLGMLCREQRGDTGNVEDTPDRIGQDVDHETWPV